MQGESLSERIRQLWPAYDMHRIAEMLGVPESIVYNEVARARGHTEPNRHAGRLVDPLRLAG